MPMGRTETGTGRQDGVASEKWDVLDVKTNKQWLKIRLRPSENDAATRKKGDYDSPGTLTITNTTGDVTSKLVAQVVPEA